MRFGAEIHALRIEPAERTMVLLVLCKSSVRTLQNRDQETEERRVRDGISCLVNWQLLRAIVFAMRIEDFSFGSIQIDAETYEHDVVIDRGEIKKRKKKPSKKFRDKFGHTLHGPWLLLSR